MKQLSIEEKAKRYDEALEKARMVLQERGNEPDGASVLSDLFPELAESEDERIAKELLTFFRESMYGGHILTNKEYDSWLVWLEKQGKNNMGISEATKQKLEDNLNNALEKETPESWNEFLEKQSGTFTKKDVNDAYLKGVCDAKHELEKQGELSVCNTPSREIILAIWELGNEWKELTGGSISTKYDTQLKYIQKHWQESDYYLRIKQGEQKPAWSEEDELHIRELESLVKQVWATAEHRNDKDTIHKMSDLSFFLKTLKPQLKQEWSEEDEILLKLSLKNLTELKDRFGEYYGRVGSCIDWLKSLRPQNRWKPNEEEVNKIISIDQQVCAEWGISKYTKEHKEVIQEIIKRFIKS